MNLKRFTGRTPRDALALVRQAFGDDAVVMSTKPCAEGVEVLAMAPESVEDLERVGAGLPAPTRAEPRPSTFGALGMEASRLQPAARRPAGAAGHQGGAPAFDRVEPTFDGRAPEGGVGDDVRQLQMSTLSFQDYVRERMLKRRQAELGAAVAEPEPPAPPVVSPIAQARARLAAQQTERADARQASAHGFADSTFGAPGVARAAAMAEALAAPMAPRTARPVASPPARAAAMPNAMPAPTAAPMAARPAAAMNHAADPVPALHKVAPVRRPDPPVLRHAVAQGPAVAAPAAAADSRPDQTAMMSELRSMRGLIEQRFGALAFMEKLQRQPRQAQLTQRLLDAGFSPALTRRLAECLPAEVEEISWAAGVLERNLATGEREAALEDAGGVYALIGATGVGKTTSTAKIAAAFATKHGAANLGLVTLDAYRVAAHEQLRTYGRILGVPVHTAHDRASLEDLLELLAGKRMVLIDTAGMAQRDTRTRELLEMLQRPAINRLVVISAAAQGETIEDQLSAYAGPGCRGVVLSKVDEAVKLAPALDAMIRARLKVLAVANGQRVPEDWHRLSAHALVQRALRAQGAPAWRMEPAEVNLVFAGQPFAAGAGNAAPGAAPTLA
ncbi:MAG: flagellar biosynthesis protein FlhF [Rubrivivax sp.]|nr:flagellar biosynthesis protein FlhF [Rubrivivax sp.]